MKALIAICVLAWSITTQAESKKEIIRQITDTATVAGIDPDLAIAIAMVESSLNPKAVGALNEQGLFQLRPEYHPVVIGNTTHNILVGVTYLLELKTKNKEKYGYAWFVLYNTGPYNPPKNPRQTKYYKKVVREINKLKVQRYLAVR